VNRVFEIFNQLQSTNSKIEKSKILTENSDNILFKETLKWLLNPFVLTGISDKKLSKTVAVLDNIIIGLTEWSEVMEYLSVNNTGRNEDIRLIQDFISYQPIEYQETYKQLITKSLKLGIDAKTVNSVYKDLVPTFNVMLANKYFEKPQIVEGKEFTITEKIDGFRLATLIHNGEIEFYSRQGQKVDGLIEIETDLKAFCVDRGITDFFFDGELVAVNCEDISSDENYKIVTKTARTKGIKSGLKYDIFDCLSYESFINQRCDTKYSFRRVALNDYATVSHGIHINFLPALYSGSDTEQIMIELEKARNNHKEGVMVSLNDGMYEFKRTNQLLKCKVMQDADLKIVDVYEGTGKNKGKLGGIIVEFEYEDNTYLCECGSGFDDKERMMYYDVPQMLIGKIATIQYFEISKNDNGGYGLRFPVWTHRIRDDKTEISMN
jgi:DNA ligase 1